MEEDYVSEEESQDVEQDDLDLTGVSPGQILASLSYLAILVFVPLIAGRNDPFVVFHAKQGLVLFVGYVLALLVVQWMSIVGSVLLILFFTVSIVGFLRALQGSLWKIPVIGSLADRFRV